MLEIIYGTIALIVFGILAKNMYKNIKLDNEKINYEKDLLKEQITALKNDIEQKKRILENQDILTLELIDYIDTKTDKLRIENNNKIENQEKITNLIKEITETMEEMEIECINIENIKKGDNQNG